jgi:tRNA(Ile)-lysidine synthase
VCGVNRVFRHVYDVGMDPVAAALREASRTGLIPPGSTVLLAVSGGADSMAMLYGAAEAANDFGWTLSVGHVHHGWRPREGDRDLAFVSGHARRLGLAFVSRHCDARRVSRELGLSPEAGARHVRYAALVELAKEAGATLIATAHQNEDAIESHLLSRERRGGLAGLAGPRASRADGVVRPLLAVTRAEILRFLSGRGVSFRRDATNGNLRLARNRVRRTLARLREAPGGEETVRGVAEQVAVLGEERRLLESDYESRIRPAIRFGRDRVAVDAALVADCPQELRRLILFRLAAPFARPGRPPMTGREREQILALVAAGGDFRFEAGRRIRLERRRGVLSARPRDAGTVYHPPAPIGTTPSDQEAAP